LDSPDFVSSASLYPITPNSTLLPYTTLFRSGRLVRVLRDLPDAGTHLLSARSHRLHVARHLLRRRSHHTGLARGLGGAIRHPGRSEEHTSELQSRENLVCRLLLAKKKKVL